MRHRAGLAVRRSALVTTTALLLLGAASAGAESAVTVPAPTFTSFLAVDLISGDDGWMVGFRDGKTLAERWDGRGWRVVRTANRPLGSQYNQQLHAVSASSADDAWAVGVADGGEDQRPIIERWHGDHWRLMSCELPPGTTFTSLRSVVDISPDDVWIIGTNHTIDTEDTLALHWDGSECTYVPTVNPGDKQGNILDAVSASGPDDVWAVGQYFVGFRPKTLAEHWDGRRWSVVATPDPGHLGGELLSVTGTADDDAWATGWAWTNRRSHQESVTLHWDGAAWRFVKSVNPRKALFDSTSIDAVGSVDVWAVGTRYFHNVGAPLAERWTGRRWVNTKAAVVSGRFVDVNGTSVVGADDVWMVGAVGGLHNSDGLIEHWNGRRWRVLSP